VKILHRCTRECLFEVTAKDIKELVRQAVRENVNLSGADLSGADLSWANLSGADLSGANLDRVDLSGAKHDYKTVKSIDEAITLAPDVFKIWEEGGLQKAAENFKALTPDGESGRGLVILQSSLVGGFCYILSRRAIWWWGFRCPHEEVALILWNANEMNDPERR